MAFATLDGLHPIFIGPVRQDTMYLPAAVSSGTMDAANEAIILYGVVVTEDGASHTIDTTGSSSLQWLPGTVTFDNAGTTLKVGLAAIDITTETTPPRAVNSGGVITFDVSKTLTGGGGGVATSTWATHAPDSGSKTIANGDIICFAIQMTARGGSDSISINNLPLNLSGQTSGITAYTAATYTSAGDCPNAVIVFNDGTLGFFINGYVASAMAQVLGYNSSSSPNEYGNIITLPFSTYIDGIGAMTRRSTAAANYDLVLYSDPLGTPVAERAISVDGSIVVGAGTAGQPEYRLFSSPFLIKANTPYAIAMKPNATTSSLYYKRYADAAHRKSDYLGTAIYGVSRTTSGAFSIVNSSKDIFTIGYLVTKLRSDITPTYALGI